MSVRHQPTGALANTADTITDWLKRYRQAIPLSIRLMIAVAALVALTAAAVGTMITRNIESAMLPGEFETAAAQVRMLAFGLETYVQTARSDVVAFRNSGAVIGIMRSILAGGTDPSIAGKTTQDWLDRLAQRFGAELAAKPAYSLMRVIDIPNGRELLRIDRNGTDGAIRRVPDAELQYKGERKFFRDSIKLPPEGVYVSEIGLAHLRHVVRVPHLPTMRVATVVRTPEGDPFAIIVINVHLRTMFEKLRESVPPPRQVFIVNGRGDYLLHPDRSKEFSFMRGNPTQWQQDFPTFAAALGTAESGMQIVSNPRGEKVAAVLASAHPAGGPRVSVIEQIPYSDLVAPASAIGRLSTIVGIIAVLLSSGLALLLARTLTRPLAMMTANVERFTHDESLPVPTDACGEIGVLARAFARMASEVRDKTQALKHEIDGHRRTAVALDQEAERARLYSAAVASSQDAILTMTPEGVLTGWNPGAERLFGYSAVEVIGQSYVNLVPPDRRDEPKTITAKILAGEPIEHFDTVRLHKSGRLIDVSVSVSPVKSSSGDIIGICGIARDITETKKARAALAESERMARKIIATALDAFIQLDQEGRILEWNPQAETVFGWPQQEAVGKPLSDLIIPARYRAQYKRNLLHFIRTGRGAFFGRRIETEAICKDGREIKVEVAITAMRRLNGIVFNGFIRDLTEKSVAEEKLRQAQRMETIGQLTGGIAHDFNNILTVITGTIGILANAVAGRPRLVEITKLIQDAAKAGSSLTSGLLAFARKQPLNPRRVDINQLVMEVTNLLRPTLGEQIEIQSILKSGVWPAYVDSSELTTALLNLAVNSRDAMPEGGKLTFEISNTHLAASDASLHDKIIAGDYIRISVNDTGCGMPASIRDRVFEPFFTTKDSGEGTGLGLSMVYGFVKQSGGHIKINSEESRGTTINIYLPRANEIGLVHAAPTDSVPFGRNEVILIVEDNELVRNYVVTQLEDLGYRLHVAANAAQALALIEKDIEFDLLFTDVIMPGGMNGRQLAEEVVKRRGPTRILFTSGYTQNAMIHHGRLDPGVLLLKKPYSQSDLARMIRAALDRENEGALQAAYMERSERRRRAAGAMSGEV
jgi:PAS domain S-box-containing protein